MVKVTPGVTLCRLTIQFEPTENGSAADVCYRDTSLGPPGDEFVARFTDSHYVSFMREWEHELNHPVNPPGASPGGHPPTSWSARRPWRWGRRS